MEAPNGHRALVRGFDGISADEAITFCGQLPDGAYCYLCQNVFPFLNQDPDGHYFCESCTRMSTTDGAFECPEDGALYSLEFQLTRKVSVSEKVRTQTLYCPQSPKDNPIKIPFSALKAHMKACQCAFAAMKQGKAVSSPRPHPVTLPSSKKDENGGESKHGVEVPEKSAQKTHEEDAAPSIVETKVACPYCDGWFLKGEVTSHIKQKTCTRRPQQPALPSSSPVQPQYEGDSQSSPMNEMECVDSYQRFGPHDMQVDSSPVDGGPKSTTKDRDDERIASLEEQVKCLSEKLEKFTGDFKKVYNILNMLAPDIAPVEKLYPNIRTDF